MVVRVNLLLKTSSGSTRIVKALVNSGYEADSPQLMIPIQLARELALWPPSEYREYVFETAGGPVRVWLIPRALIVQVIVNNTVSKEVVVDIVISPYIEESLISDILASEFELVLIDIGKGLWKFKWEPIDIVHKSA